MTPPMALPALNSTPILIAAPTASALSPEVIVSLIFGMTTLVTAIVALWQNRRRLSAVSYQVWIWKYRGMSTHGVRLEGGLPS